MSRCRAAGPVTTFRPNPLAWQLASVIVQHDHRRLCPLPDGSVLVDGSPAQRKRLTARP
jgi:hypothetical protein